MESTRTEFPFDILHHHLLAMVPARELSKSVLFAFPNFGQAVVLLFGHKND